MENKEDTIKLIADHLETGFLENIIDMFKYDNSLYPLIGELLLDERIRVRLGAVALVESLTPLDPEGLSAAIPGVAKLLKNSNATIRGDAAHVLGIIGHRDSLPLLSELSEDENEMVREIVEDSIKLIDPAAKEK